MTFTFKGLFLKHFLHEIFDVKKHKIIEEIQASGVPGFANLNPGQQSSIIIPTNIPSDEELGRYVVLPGGSAAS